MSQLLALFGWTEFIVDGTTVYLHATGVVVYNQGPQSSVPDRRRLRTRRIFTHPKGIQ